MRKKTWDLYAPIYKRAMQADHKIYEFMYDRIPQVIKDMEVLEIATGPGLLAKHVASAAKRMIATDYSDGMIAEAKKGDYPDNLTFEIADAMNLPYRDIYKNVGLFHKLMIRFCDSLVNMRIVRIDF